jgi:hypothetical protein
VFDQGNPLPESCRTQSHEYGQFNFSWLSSIGTIRNFR